MWNKTLNSPPWLEQAIAGSQHGKTIHIETILDQAAKDARSGGYQAALGRLDQLREHGSAPSPLELDLRAKIYAQLGYYLDAERCWMMAAKADPANPMYPLALERLRKRHRSRSGMAIMGTVMIGTTALMLLIAQNLYHSSQMRGLAEVRGTITTVAATLDARLSGMAKEAAIMGRLDELPAQTTQLRSLADAIQAAGREEQAVQERNRFALARIEERLEMERTQLESGLADLRGQLETLRAALDSKPGAVADVAPTDIPPTTFPDPASPQENSTGTPGATDTSIQ